jgi:hypothetical protein
MGCFFVLTGLLSAALARGYEGCCCLLLFQLPFYIVMLVTSLFVPNGEVNQSPLSASRH